VSSHLDELAERKQLLLAQLQLQRMETALHAAELREAMRPANMFGGAIARPAAVIGVVNMVAPLLGLRRFARWVRAGTVALVAYRILREWRSRRRPPELPPESPGLP
jgi:hypothetical protein